MSDFVVNDKRLFNKGGELNAEQKSEALAKEETFKKAESSPKSSGTKPGNSPPPVTFSGFIMGLATSALMHLGEFPGAENSVDLELARQTIDLLALLEEKTKGNLDNEDAELLKNLLHDLRLRYVAKLKA